MLPQGFGEAAEKLRRSTVQVVSESREGRGVGSGVIWSADGTVVSNAHVASGEEARIQLWDGRTFQARVAARDARADLAMLRLHAGGLTPVAWRDSESLRPGELVLAVGNPLGFVGALTTGVVHASGSVRGLGRRRWVQAAIRLAPGNSGGPLADAEGRVVGINTMVVQGGLALAIPSDNVADFLKHGSRPPLGVVVRLVADRMRGLGLLVLEVLANSPAETASLLIGDLLVSVNGRDLRSVDDLGDAIDESAGGVLKIGFLRGDRGHERQVSVLLNASRMEAA
ncbi:MAG TPA: trypsin-like peptidase domain-containing protein [Bryobacteraceae bacterium]|nr:trypsin-like peptidase domain-containing protein [Bryobacteraceae bacterium]